MPSLLKKGRKNPTSRMDLLPIMDLSVFESSLWLKLTKWIELNEDALVGMIDHPIVSCSRWRDRDDGKHNGNPR